jgi:putative integral membrane protein (TIGR02587 family)
METWWLGAQLPPWQSLALLGGALVCCVPLARSIGFKRESTLRSHLDQAVHAVAVGAAAAFAILLALNRISLDDPPATIAGLVAVQAFPLSLGAAVANAVFKRGKDRHEADQEGPWSALLHKVGATAIGAAFVAFSAAPTEEITHIAAGLTYGHQLALLLLSLLIAHAIVFHSGYHPSQEDGESSRKEGALAHVSETTTAYVVSLTLALAAILFYNRTGAHAPLPALLTQTLVLGLPAAIGGAAGRLVL